MSALEVLSEPVWQRLTWTLLHFLWQGLGVAVVVMTLLWAWPVRRSSHRYVLCLAALLVMAACPMVTFLVTETPVPAVAVRCETEERAETEEMAPEISPVGEAEPEPAATEVPPILSGHRTFVDGTHDRQLPPESSESVPLPAVPPTQASSAPSDTEIAADSSVVTDSSMPATEDEGLAQYVEAIQPYFLIAWIGGVLVLAVRLLFNWLLVRWVAWGRRPIPADLASRVATLAGRLRLTSGLRVCVSDRVRVAIVVGLWRPLVLLPTSWLTQMTPEVLEAVIGHELAHIRRWDLWVNLLQRLVETALFYHPAVWWLSRRLSLEREMCTDELAVAATGERFSYATALEQLGRIRLGQTLAQFGATMGDNKMALLSRVKNILGKGPSHDRARWWPAGLVGLLVPPVIWLAAMSMAAPGKPDSHRETTAESATEITVEKEEESSAGEALTVDGIGERVMDKFAVGAMKDLDVVWCKPVNGLQLGVRLFRSKYGFDDAFVASEIILRNVSDKPLTVMSPEFAATARILTHKRQPVPEVPDQASSYQINPHPPLLKPGTSVSFRDREFLSGYLISELGRYLLQVEYEVTPETGKKLDWAELQIDGKDLVGWTGKLVAEAPFTIDDRGVVWGESRGPLRAGVILPPTIEYGRPVRITALVRNGSDEPVTVGTLAPKAENPRPYFWRYSAKNADGIRLPGVYHKEGREPVAVTIPPWRYLVVNEEVPVDSVTAWLSYEGVPDGGKFRLEAHFQSPNIKGLNAPIWSGGVLVETEARVTVTPWGGEESDGLRTRVHLDMRQYRVGQCVHIAAEALNTTDRAIVVGMQDDLEVGIRVTDAEGKAVTKLREKSKTGVAHRTLQAHERTTLTGYDLALQYDLSRPGRYRVRYVGPEGTFGWLTPLSSSNVVDFEVLGTGSIEEVENLSARAVSIALAHFRKHDAALADRLQVLSDAKLVQGPAGKGWLVTLHDVRPGEDGRHVMSLPKFEARAHRVVVIGAYEDSVISSPEEVAKYRPPYPELFINNHRYGPTNGLTGSLRPTGSATCGHPCHVSEVTWELLKFTPFGGCYRITRRYPADGKNADTTETDFVYSGKPVVVFEDDVQRISVRPGWGIGKIELEINESGEMLADGRATTLGLAERAIEEQLDCGFDPVHVVVRTPMAENAAPIRSMIERVNHALKRQGQDQKVVLEVFRDDTVNRSPIGSPFVVPLGNGREIRIVPDPEKLLETWLTQEDLGRVCGQLLPQVEDGNYGDVVVAERDERPAPGEPYLPPIQWELKDLATFEVRDVSGGQPTSQPDTPSAPSATQPDVAGAMLARIVLPAKVTPVKGLFPAKLELTNNGKQPVRVVTLCQAWPDSSKRAFHVSLRPDRWKSDPPPVDQSAKSVVELSPGESTTLPFEVVDGGRKTLRVTASYAVSEGFAKKLNVWSGSFAFQPARVNLERVEEGELKILLEEPGEFPLFHRGKAILREKMLQLIEKLESPDPKSRRLAIERLANLGSNAKEAVPALVRRLKDEDAQVRSAAAGSFHKILPPTVNLYNVFPVWIFTGSPATLELMSPEEKVEFARVTAIANEEKAKAAKIAVPALIEALTDESFYVRQFAALSLGAFGPHARDAVRPLIRSLEDESEAVRMRAVGALGGIGPDAKEAVPKLIAYFKKYQQSRLRTPAIRSLGKIGPGAKEAVPFLIELLQNRGESRYRVAQALGGIGPEAKAAIPALIAALEDAERLVRAYAAEALGKIGTDTELIVPALMKAEKDEDLLVRDYAERALQKLRAGTKKPSNELPDEERTPPPPSRNEAADILDDAAKHPRNVAVGEPDGTSRRPKYGDVRLERAEEALKNYAKPWTVKKVLSWYKEAKDHKTRAHLLRVLAASRHPKAAVELGKALDDSVLDVRVAATYGLLDYFLPTLVSGGTESHMIAASEWWQENRQRLLTMAATQPEVKWGQAVGGLQCRLTADKPEVPMGSKVDFILHLQFDSKTADPKVGVLNRTRPHVFKVDLTFTDTKTGKTFQRAAFDIGMIRPQVRVPLKDKPLEPENLEVYLLTHAGEQVPAGTYSVTATCDVDPSRVRIEPTPKEESRVWAGKIVSGPVPLTVTPAEAKTVEVKVPTSLVFLSDNGRLAWDFSEKDMAAVSLRVRPGFNLTYRLSWDLLLNNKPVMRSGGGGSGGYEGSMGLMRPDRDNGPVSGALSNRVLAGGKLRVVADLEIIENSAPGRQGWSPKGPVIHKARLEGVATKGTVANLVRQPEETWGTAVDGIQTRLAVALGGGSVFLEDTEMFLLVRNVSAAEIAVDGVGDIWQFVTVKKEGMTNVPGLKPSEPAAESIRLKAGESGEWEVATTRLNRIVDLKPGTYTLQWRVPAGKVSAPLRVPPPSNVVYLKVARRPDGRLLVTELPAPVEAAELLKEFKNAEYSWKQGDVAEELIALGDKSVIPEMIQMLKSKIRRERCNAAQVLAGLGDQRGLAAVLAELKDTGVRPALTAFRSDGTPDVQGQIKSDRYYAAHVLGEIGDRRAVPALIEVLEDVSINQKAAIVLGDLGDQRAVPPLKEMLDSTDPSQRLWAGYGLAKLKDPLGVPTVAEFLKDAQWTQRRYAARALGEFGDTRAVAPLIEALKDESPDVRVSAAKALGKLGDPSAIDALEALSDDDAVTTSGPPTAVRDAAAEALKTIEQKDATTDGKKQAARGNAHAGPGASVAESSSIVLAEKSDTPPGLYAVGPNDERAEPPDAPHLYELARTGKIPRGCAQLIGRIGTYSAEDEFQVSGLRREGNRFTTHIRYIRAVPEGRNDRSAYFRAGLPADLPPGRYYALVQLAEYLREGGRIVFAPKTKIRAFAYLTCMFDVPPKGSDPPAQIDRQLPGSGLSMAEAAGEGCHAIAVCETTGEAPFNFEGGWQYRTWPKTKVIEVLTGKLEPGQELELQYVWIDKPSRRERFLAKGEKAIWAIRKGVSSGKAFYTGIKALADTPENRQKVTVVRMPSAEVSAKMTARAEDLSGLRRGMTRASVYEYLGEPNMLVGAGKKRVAYSRKDLPEGAPRWLILTFDQRVGEGDYYAAKLHSWKFVPQKIVTPPDASPRMRNGFVEGYRAGYPHGLRGESETNPDVAKTPVELRAAVSKGFYTGQYHGLLEMIGVEQGKPIDSFVASSIARADVRVRYAELSQRLHELGSPRRVTASDNPAWLVTFYHLQPGENPSYMLPETLEARARRVVVAGDGTRVISDRKEVAKYRPAPPAKGA